MAGLLLKRMRKVETTDIWRKGTPPAKNVDAFIKASPPQTRAHLKQLRKIVKETVPGAEEKISYRMPLYTYQGKMFVAFAGFKNHVGFYGLSGSFLDPYRKELKDYKMSKGTIRFPLDKPLPVTLLKRLIKDRIRTNEDSGRKTR